MAILNRIDGKALTVNKSCRLKNIILNFCLRLNSLTFFKSLLWPAQLLIVISFLNLADCAPTSTLYEPSMLGSVSSRSTALLGSIQDTFQEDEAQVMQASPCSPIEPPYLSTEDKIALAPIVFQGKPDVFIVLRIIDTRETL